MKIKLTVRILFLVLGISFANQKLTAQLKPYVIFSGPNGTGTTLIGSSITINGVSSSGFKGAVGGVKMVQTTGNATIKAHIHSWDKVSITNSNIIQGDIVAGNSSAVPGSPPGTAISIGSSLMLTGNIHSRGDVTIGGGTITGSINISPGVYISGPTPSILPIGTSPVIPPQPTLPDPKPDLLTNPIYNSTTNFTTTADAFPIDGIAGHGVYNNVTFSGNKTLTLRGPGIYVFNSMSMTGNSNKIVFDFQNSPRGKFYVYIKQNADLGKVDAGFLGIADANSAASRTWIEVQGLGTGTTSPTASFLIANGAGGGSKLLATVYATKAAINIGSGTGGTSLTGALFSKTAVNIQSGVVVNYEPFLYCTPPNVDAGPDKPLIISTPTTTVTGSSTTPGVTFSWQALNGGIITSTSNTSNTSTITVSEAGTYVLTASSDVDCFSRDTVVVKNPIGAELKSIYLNNPPNSPFFIITPDGYIMIDVIVNAGFYTTVLNLLQTADYGLRNIQSNGASQFIITGEFPIVNLAKLNLVTEINYCRPYYQEITHSGVVTSAGDTSVRSWLVRNGYNLNGDGIKIGVISNSYNTITTATLAPFKTNTEAQDIANGDLPGLGNIYGYTKPVQVLEDLPGEHSDEGRAMSQEIHDLAPGAELAFSTGSITAGHFAQKIKALRDAGCNIIVDDLTYITEQFLTDGVVAQAVNEVTSTGTTYFSAAGNFASRSYESAFDSVPAPPGFTGTAHNFGSGDIYQSVTFAPGKYIIVLQWVDDDYSIGLAGTKNDLDIFTTPNTNGTLLSGSNRINIGGDAIEIMTFTITTPTTTNILIVNKTPGSKPAWLKYVVFRGDITFNEYATGTSTIVGQANASGAIAIGAARFDKAFPYPGPLATESFSSTGGTRVFTKSGTSVVAEIRNKPELVGPDGVNTTLKMGNLDYDGDSYYNFFGTSAAAPHAAAVAALIMQGRKKFLGQDVTTPSQIRSLLTSTATDMGTAGFDFTSGYGFINADAAMRNFAAPTPSIEELIVPLNPIPNQTVFKVTGNNLSNNSKIYYGNTELTTTVLNNNEATALIPVLTGNQPIRVYTPPYPGTILVNGVHLDGGFSNSLYFFSKLVTVIAKDAARKYGEVTTLIPTILVDGVPLENTNPKLTLRDLGLNNITLKVPDKAINPGNIGTYKLSFSQTSPDDPTLFQKYNYEFIEGTLTIEKLPVTITAQNITVNLGENIPDPTFTYLFDGSNIPDPGAFLNSMSSAHQSQLVQDVLGLVNGEAVTIENGEAVVIENGEAVVIENGQAFIIGLNGVKDSIVNAQSLAIANGVVTNTTPYVLNTADIRNLSFLATIKSLQNTRVVNSNPIIDLTQESILDFNKNAAQTTMLRSVSAADSKGLVDVNSYTNGEAVVIENGEAVVIENGEAVVIENGTVIIENGEAVVIDNVTGEHIPLRYSNNRTGVIVDEKEVGRGLSQLKSLNIITGLSIGNQFLMPGTLSNNNLDITYVPGIVTIKDPCPIVTRKPFTNFGSTTQKETSLWVNVSTKVSRQLANGETLLFTSGSITFNNITAYEQGTTNTPITTKSIPDGMIIADASVTAPTTHYDVVQKIWITKIPVPFSSTSDIFISGAIINSNDKGFKKLNGATTVVKGKFYSSTCAPFSDQWTYAIAAYQPIFGYTAIAGEGLVTSINGTYRAGTPTPFVNALSTQTHLVNGGSGGGGNNYTGSSSSYENYTACPSPAACPSGVSRTSGLSQEEIQGIASAREVQIMPNPATNYIMLSFVPGRTGNSKLVLYTVDGRKAFETNFGNTEATVKYQKTVDVSKLVNGIYLLQLWNEGKVTTSKIMISR